jgi:hypothetical protein
MVSTARTIAASLLFVASSRATGCDFLISVRHWASVCSANFSLTIKLPWWKGGELLLGGASANRFFYTRGKRRQLQCNVAKT